MKIDRLMGIVVYLLNHGRTSAQKLAEEFEVSPRTIMRDLEALDQAGIPIQSFYGAEGGYQIMEDFVLEKQVGTGRDYGWIVTALRGMVSAYANKSLERTLEKMESLSGTKSHPVFLDLGAAAEDETIREQLKLLEEAIGRKCMVRFSYTNSRDEAKEIVTEPVCLQYKWYNWYLIGYQEKYQDYCMFKLVRMEKLEVTETANTREHDPAAFAEQKQEAKILHVRLFGEAGMKAKCREYLNGKVTREYENGDFEFCFSVPEHETFWYGALLSFGSRVKVIEPEELKTRIVKNCAELLKMYGGDSGGAVQNV